MDWNEKDVYTNDRDVETRFTRKKKTSNYSADRNVWENTQKNSIRNTLQQKLKANKIYHIYYFFSLSADENEYSMIV